MKSGFNLEGQVIVVAGGAGLLGRAVIEGICQEDGTAIIADADIHTGQDFATRMQQSGFGKQVVFFEVDIGKRESIENLIAEVTKKYEKIDALVNCAYPKLKGYGSDFLELSSEDFCDALNSHLGGCFLMSQSFCKYYLSTGSGNIINVASIYGMMAPRFEIYSGTNLKMPVEYAVIKAGVIQITKYMAKLLLDKNIRVNCVSPGGIQGDQPRQFIEQYGKYTAKKGMLASSDIVGAILFLLSERSKAITGQNLVIDEGFTL